MAGFAEGDMDARGTLPAVKIGGNSLVLERACFQVESIIEFHQQIANRKDLMQWGCTDDEKHKNLGSEGV